MINKISILYLQSLIVILETAPNLLQPEYSIKILNTEHTILSLGNVDNDDDLELIKGPENARQLQEKLNKLHKFVKFEELTERPKEKLYMAPYNNRKSTPLFELPHPDLPHMLAVNEKHLSELERRSKFRKIKKVKRKRKRKRKRKEICRREELTKMDQIKVKVTKSRLNQEGNADNNNNLEKEYFDDIAQNLNDNTAFKYSDEGKPEETVEEVISKIIDVKTPKDCRNYTGLGIQAVECIWKNFRTGEIDRKQLFCSISLILLIWFFLYLLIAIPLWCTKGWCCCCCRCSFCFPYKTVADIKRYVAENPPGTYTDSKCVKTDYVPTPREIELYERLRRLIADF